MKNYYNILGVKEDADINTIKKAYRKLAVKFHPDKNEGDIFFTDRFRDIQEAYDILSNPIEREEYNKIINSKTINLFVSNNLPEIEIFTSDKKRINFNEEVTIQWKTLNTDKVYIKPFGELPPIGSRTYRLKNFKDEKIFFELIAENTYIKRQTTRKIFIYNNTYEELNKHFRKKILKDKTISDFYKRKNRNEIELLKRKYNYYFLALAIIILFFLILLILK